MEAFYAVFILFAGLLSDLSALPFYRLSRFAGFVLMGTGARHDADRPIGVLLEAGGTVRLSRRHPLQLVAQSDREDAHRTFSWLPPLPGPLTQSGDEKTTGKTAQRIRFC